MEPCRLACVRYLNTAPLVEGLEHARDVRLLPAVPASIVGMVARGEADAGLASIVDSASPPGVFAVLGGGMIGCDGPTLTVRVFSADPLPEVRVLHADTDSHTSVILARLLLRRVTGAPVEVRPFDVRERVSPGTPPGPSLAESWPRTVLLIGDKVVTDPPPASRYPHQMDLGETWRAWTGLPFVYAAWMCRREDAGSARMSAVRDLLDRQRRHNTTRLAWIAARRAPAARWPIDLASRYLGGLLRFDLDDRARAGAERFIAEATAQALLEPGARLEWADSAVHA